MMRFRVAFVTLRVRRLALEAGLLVRVSNGSRVCTACKAEIATGAIYFRTKPTTGAIGIPYRRAICAGCAEHTTNRT